MHCSPGLGLEPIRNQRVTWLEPEGHSVNVTHANYSWARCFFQGGLLAAQYQQWMAFSRGFCPVKRFLVAELTNSWMACSVLSCSVVWYQLRGACCNVLSGDPAVTTVSTLGRTTGNDSGRVNSDTCLLFVLAERFLALLGVWVQVVLSDRRCVEVTSGSSQRWRHTIAFRKKS